MRDLGANLWGQVQKSWTDRTWWSDRAVDLSMFLYGLGYYLNSTQVQYLYIQKACQIGSSSVPKPTYPQEVCENLSNGSFPDEQLEIQTVVSRTETLGQIMMQLPVLTFSL